MRFGENTIERSEARPAIKERAEERPCPRVEANNKKMRTGNNERHRDVSCNISHHFLFITLLYDSVASREIVMALFLFLEAGRPSLVGVETRIPRQTLPLLHICAYIYIGIYSEGAGIHPREKEDERHAGVTLRGDNGDPARK